MPEACFQHDVRGGGKRKRQRKLPPHPGLLVAPEARFQRDKDGEKEKQPACEAA